MHGQGIVSAKMKMSIFARTCNLLNFISTKVFNRFEQFLSSFIIDHGQDHNNAAHTKRIHNTNI